MDSQLKKGLLEYSVLATLVKADSYGYQIIKDSPPVLALTQSTLYPILKRLNEGNRVTTYTQIHNGRERKYYHLTEAGRASLQQFVADWQDVEAAFEPIRRSIHEEK